MIYIINILVNVEVTNIKLLKINNLHFLRWCCVKKLGKNNVLPVADSSLNNVNLKKTLISDWTEKQPSSWRAAACLKRL